MDELIGNEHQNEGGFIFGKEAPDSLRRFDVGVWYEWRRGDGGEKKVYMRTHLHPVAA